LSETNEQPHARVTLQMLYEKQLENQKLLIELAAKMSGMEGLPERVTELEIQQAKLQWVEKIAYAALTAGVGAVMAAIIGMLGA
jgi:hypothetical protein